MRARAGLRWALACAAAWLVTCGAARADGGVDAGLVKSVQVGPQRVLVVTETPPDPLVADCGASPDGLYWWPTVVDDGSGTTRPFTPHPDFYATVLMAMSLRRPVHFLVADGQCHGGFVWVIAVELRVAE